MANEWFHLPFYFASKYTSYISFIHKDLKLIIKYRGGLTMNEEKIETMDDVAKENEE